MSGVERSNPFNLDGLVDQPAAPAKSPETVATPVPGKQPDMPAMEPRTERPTPAQLNRLVEETGFVSRQRPRFGPRRRTGRDRQLNLKVRDQDIEAFYEYADRKQITLGEAFQHAVEALGKNDPNREK